MNFPGDQEDWEAMPPEMREHLWKAYQHKAGLGPHPGKYKGPDFEYRNEEGDERDEPTEGGDLARLREEQETGEEELHQQEEQRENTPTPPQEALPSQPPLQGGKKHGPAKPSSGTPAAIGQQIVQPPPPA